MELNPFGTVHASLDFDTLHDSTSGEYERLHRSFPKVAQAEPHLRMLVPLPVRYFWKTALRPFMLASFIALEIA